MSEEDDYDCFDNRPFEVKTDKLRSEVSAEEGRAAAMLRTEFKRLLSEWVTKVNQKKMTKDEFYRRGAQWLKDKSVEEDDVEFAYELMRRHLEFQRIPHGALPSAVELAKQFVKRYGEASGYPPWVSPRKRVLYVLLLILGAYGRVFQYACDAVAKETSIDSKAVWRFLHECEVERLIYPELRGVSCGRATSYLLIKNLDAWEDLGKVLVGQSDPTGDEIKKRCPWLFDLDNNSNRWTWEAYQESRNGNRRRV